VGIADVKSYVGPVPRRLERREPIRHSRGETRNQVGKDFILEGLSEMAILSIAGCSL